MSNIFQTVIDTVSIVVGWIDAPLISSVRVWHIANSVSNGVSHIWINMSHVNLHAQTALILSKAALAHMFKQLQVFLDTAVAVWRLNHLVSLFLNLGLRAMVHISFSSLDKFASEVIKLLEVIGGKGNFEGFVAEPLHTVSDVINELLVLLHGICVVIAQVGLPAIFFSKSKVKAHSLCVPDVKVTIGLRRESSHNLASSCCTVLFQNFFRVSRSFNISSNDI